MTVIQPFQVLAGRHIQEACVIDAKRLAPDQYAALGTWIAEVVLCRLRPGYDVDLTVWYR